MQVIAYLLGGTAVVALFGKSEWSDRIIAAVLATMWGWTGIAYHLAFFTTKQPMCPALCLPFKRLLLPTRASFIIGSLSASAQV